MPGAAANEGGCHCRTSDVHPHNHTKATWRCIALCLSRRQDEVSVWEASVRSQPARTRTLKQDVCAA
ncbi:MAG: hypothetical protein ACPIOQ_33350 [Promethearchaeia archaeon]